MVGKRAVHANYSSFLMAGSARHMYPIRMGKLCAPEEMDQSRHPDQCPDAMGDSILTGRQLALIKDGLAQARIDIQAGRIVSADTAIQRLKQKFGFRDL